MMAAGFAFDPVLNPAPAQSAPIACGTRPGGVSPGSFETILHAAVSGANAAPPAGGRTRPPEDLSAEGAPADPPARGVLTPPLPETPRGDDPAWAALAQLIQGLIADSGRADAPPQPPDPAEEAPGADPGEEGEEGFLRFIDLLKHLQTLQAGGAQEAGGLLDLERMRGLLAHAATSAGAGPQSGLSADVSGPAPAPNTVTEELWGLLRRVIADRVGTEAGPSRPPSADEKGPVPPEAGVRQAPSGISPAPRLDAVETRGAGAGGEGAGWLAGGRDASRKAPEARPATPPEAAAGPPRTPGTVAGDPGREPLPPAGRGGAEGPAAVPAGLQRPSAAPSVGGGEAEAPAPAAREVRSVAALEPAGGRTAEAGAGATSRAAAGHGGKPDVVDQIVQRAAVLLRSDRGEARIDLKPEYLGQVRMHIVTDHQMVTVRILAESPMVRDLIEHNLHQLKSDLHQQGLQVERVEVSVSEDPRRDAGRHARTGRGGKGGRSDENGGEGPVPDEETARVSPAERAGGRTTINMFV
jgi:hypothetical protein